MFLLLFCLPNAEVEAHNVSLICHSETGALRVSVAEDRHLVIAKSTRRRMRQDRYRLSPWTTGSTGNQETEHVTHFQCSSCEIVRVEASGVTRRRQRV